MSGIESAAACLRVRTPDILSFGVVFRLREFIALFALARRA